MPISELDFKLIKIHATFTESERYQFDNLYSKL